MNSKSLSPIIGTLIILGISLVVAGITYTWTSTYTQEQTKAVEQQADVNTLVQAQSAIGLILKSASTTGKLIVANNSSQPIIINQLMVDGNLMSIPPVTIPAGSIASIDANINLSAGQSITLITTAGASKTITVTEETLTQYTSTASFSDLLNNQIYINSGSTTANITSGEARLSGQVWAILKDLNISNNSGSSVAPSLALDVNGNPSIAWHDNTLGNYEVYYRDWNGSDWTTVAGDLSGPSLNVSNNAGSSVFVSLALDVNGFPSIAWYDNTSGNNEIYYRDWNGTAWVTAKGNLFDSDLNVSNTSGYSYNPSLTLDVNGNPSIAWPDDTPGTWEIYYRDWNGSNWVTVSGSVGSTNLNVSNNAGASIRPYLALDSNGNPSIAWTDITTGNREIYYREWSGSSWAVLGSENVSNSGTQWSEYSPLKLDVNGNPSIAYGEDLQGVPRVYYRDWNGSDWTTAAGDLSGPSLNVSYTDGWSRIPSLALDANGFPSIAWWADASGNYEVYYRDWNGSNWTTVAGDLSGSSLNVSNNSANSDTVSLSLDANNGNPSIAWRDETVGMEIYYREWDENFASGSRAESIEVDSITNRILSATLTASTLRPAGTSITFWLSNDNGSTWTQATPGIEVTFSTAGSQLKWRADLNSSSSKITPSIYDVSINYIYEA